jgi:hypothetical protein
LFPRSSRRNNVDRSCKFLFSFGLKTPQLLWYLEKSSNAPYYGTATAIIIGANGIIADETQEAIAVYVLMMKLTFPTKKTSRKVHCGRFACASAQRHS